MKGFSSIILVSLFLIQLTLAAPGLRIKRADAVDDDVAVVEDINPVELTVSLSSSK